MIRPDRKELSPGLVFVIDYYKEGAGYFLLLYELMKESENISKCLSDSLGKEVLYAGKS